MTHNSQEPISHVRVELHPATDAWMQGDRFGTVERTYKSRKGDFLIHVVRMDVSGKLRKVSDNNIGKWM